MLKRAAAAVVVLVGAAGVYEAYAERTHGAYTDHGIPIEGRAVLTDETIPPDATLAQRWIGSAAGDGP